MIEPTAATCKWDENCPNCNKSFRGDPIPESQQIMFGGATHFSLKIGIEDSAIYDGTIAWVCPECDYAWPTKAGYACGITADILNGEIHKD